jgi:hypothetical protein
VTCTVSGKGLEISRSGISPVGTPPGDFAPGTYNGTVKKLDTATSQMTFIVTSWTCNAIPAPGTWSIDLRGADLVANSQPTTGQGQAVTVTLRQWGRLLVQRRAWSVVASAGQPLDWR